MKRIVAAVMLVLWVSHLHATEWRYNEVRDEMRDSITYASTLQSDNENQYSAPYDSGAFLDILLISKDGEISNRAALALSKGEVACQRDEICEVKVRFDDGSIEDLTTKIASDSNDMLAVFDSTAFVEKLRISKKVIIEIPVYRNGRSQFKFYPSDLKWHGIADGRPYLSEFAGVNLRDKLDLTGKHLSVKKNGVRCFDDSVELIKGWVAPANVCTYEGMVAFVSVKTKNDKKRLRELIGEINKSLNSKVKLNDGIAIWIGDETLGVSSIYLYSDDKDGLKLSFIYHPVMSKVPSEK
ncbi:hypothetical protein ACJV1Z_09185 [Klebsiella pneumoniae]|uniref:hypothetical protein n=1 Tax=Klebsiella pneumoniae complex TaxID=3390273 RepID=UPI00058F2F80|nr:MULTISPECIES: hypothetical protein [Klebsiella]HDV1851572.1 hypothetical protein [Escherichia coli]MBW8668821.1 hypothetical protein [Klebsiella pneumoniae subsp. pneumoniae]MCA4070818.1 hypothetical protein [Klebsiella pneumoniae]MCQ8664535.1 hypothetical protein [Klebsiella pneumoniae]MDX7561631.1 hypothetical protein [Klebsiella variicola]